MSELLQVGIALAVIIIVVGIVLHSKLSAVHAAALAPVSIALVPVSSAPAATLAAAAPAASPVDPAVAKWQGYLAKYGDDLWAVMKGENMSITAPDLPLAAAAGFTVSDPIKQFVAGNTPLRPADPSYDPSKTVLDASDFGHLFEPPVGTTTYTITGPARIALVIDGTQQLGERAQCWIDDGPENIVGFGVAGAVAGGVMGQVGDGQHAFKVSHNVVVGKVRVQINPA